LKGEDVTSSAKIILFSQELVNGELTEQLLRLTQRIYKKLTDEDFPELFGCKLKLRCPSLEFIKYICQILSLDKNIVNQITKLKRDLLLLVNVREFSDEAQFVDPSLSFVIPQVIYRFKSLKKFKSYASQSEQFFKLICLKCHQCKDLDLCRDPCSNLNEENTEKQ
jgi:DNA polymerase epsilon subunit 1